MRRSLTRAGARRQSSPSLASPSATLFCKATRRTSCPCRNPLSPCRLQHLLLLPARHLNRRKRKSSGTCSSGNRARRGAVSCPSQIPSPTNTSKRRGRRSREGDARASGLCSLSGASSRCYWRADRRGSGGGDGGLRRWTSIMPIIAVRMARRTKLALVISILTQMRTGTPTTGSGRESSWCRLLSLLSRMRSRRWRWWGRGSRRRRWSVLLVLRSLLEPRLSRRCRW